jgi:hypothetical protein
MLLERQVLDNSWESAMDVLRDSSPPKIYIYHIDHEHDQTYTENLIEYLDSQGVLWRRITLNADGYRPELQLCLDDCATAVLGYNSELDHSWVQSANFMDAAERRGIPVLQWILDHPSSRWAEFCASTPTNSRFILNSEQARRYFETHCLPGALTATTGGVGPNHRSRIGALTQGDFMRRPFSCMIPLNLRRVQSMEENNQSLRALDSRLADVVLEAIASAQNDLNNPIEMHVTAALAISSQIVSPQMFNSLCQIVEQSVQTSRRCKIFSIAKKFPVLIQSDESAIPFVKGSVAFLATNVGMQITLARIPLCRAVLSVSPFCDMIHDRTMNALNGGCVAIAEDNLGSKGVLKHKINSLLFRYDDDSLEECLDIVCNHPEYAYEIAQGGFMLRDNPRIRFDRFNNIVALAKHRIHPAIRT